MRTAATREDATEKSAVTPGPVAPARELLGDLLLELKQPAAALKEYQAVMKKEPNRFRAIYGAANAASLAGDQATSRTLYAQLLTICVKADNPGRPSSPRPAGTSRSGLRLSDVRRPNRSAARRSTKPERRERRFRGPAP